MVWGLFPGIYKNVSWESHMLGFFLGIVLAVFYRNQGPQQPVYEWLDDEEPGRSNAGSEEENGRMGEEEKL